MIEPRAQEILCLVGRIETADGDEAADRGREMQFLLKPRDSRGIRLRRQEPARFRSNLNSGKSHKRKLWASFNTDNHHSAAYNITPHPSQISVAPVPVIMLRRCRGIIVSQCPHELPRKGNTAYTRLRERIRS